MKAVVQRVIDASVTVNGEFKGGVHYGLLVYLGVARDDTARDADWLAEKIAHLRIFDDAEGKMNLSLVDVNHDKNEVNAKNKKFIFLRGERASEQNPKRKRIQPPQALQIVKRPYNSSTKTAPRNALGCVFRGLSSYALRPFSWALIG